MAFTDALKSGISALTDKVGNAFSSGKLEKAKIYPIKGGKLGNSITVQFNPAEYTISRSMYVSHKRTLGRDPDMTRMQSVSGEFATLHLSLYFDSITNLYSASLSGLASGLKNLVSSDKAQVGAALTDAASKAALSGSKSRPDEVAKDIATLLKYDDDEHSPLKIRFVWGKLDFTGFVVNSQLSYTMFHTDGTPVRMKVDLSLKGEETCIFQKKMQLTFSSPNRTKERLLTEGDQLWQLAQQEYNDPNQWRVIAQANGILNPRKVDRAMRLKVPSIK